MWEMLRTMAGDWIAMQTALWDAPEVVRILSAMCPQNVRNDADKCPQSVRKMSERLWTKCAIIGALYRTWCLFDAYSDDGELVGYDSDSLNEAIGLDGWAENLQHVGWLVVKSQSLSMPDFEAWLGNSAKRRLKDSKRKKESRESPPKSTSAKCPQEFGQNADQRREEKRREENSNTDAQATPVSQKGGRFEKPTPLMVTSYAKENGYRVDGASFCDFYASKGWKVGGQPMKDWQASVRTWHRKSEEKREGSSPDSKVQETQAFYDRDVKVYR